MAGQVASVKPAVRPLSGATKTRAGKLEEGSDGAEVNKGKKGMASGEGMIAPATQKMNDDDEESVNGVEEAEMPSIMPEPHLPSAKEVEEHYVRGHIPHRSWCPICEAAMGREDPHRRDAKDEDGESKMPTVGFDYVFLGESVQRVGDLESKATDVTGVVMKCFKTGQLWGYTATKKGPSDDWGGTSRVVASVRYGSKAMGSQLQKRYRRKSSQDAKRHE